MTKGTQGTILDNFIKTSTVGSRPIPLKSTAYAVEVLGGVAVVTVTRLFRNDESSPIEATMTFPVPFEAVVTDLVTKVAGRTLVGKASSKVKARETYEGAIDSGKAAVLHEELLRGLHMVSVANVAPGAELEVAATFVMPLSQADGNWRLRIPVTVGEIYGQLPLPDSDQILTGGPVEKAAVTVTAMSGTVLVCGQSPADGKATVSLDRPIEIEVVGARIESLSGRAADGRSVTLTVEAAPTREADLDAEFVLDVSGSMLMKASADGEGKVTKWDVARAGLVSAAKRLLTARDRVRLWTFANHCREIGQATGADLEALIRNCPFDNTGTELPGAVAKVTAARREANVLLVTDGKSGHRIDVQAAVASGARFTVVLIGEDALEVNVGYLAAMTGGQMFVVPGGDADLAILAAIASMRSVAPPATPILGAPESVERTVAGARITAVWSKAGKKAPKREGLEARIAAYAAGLALAGMEEREAGALAEAEGIVSHLTSIVLVDEAGEAVEGIPSTRKVALAAPATAMLRSAAPMKKGLLGSPAPQMAVASFAVNAGPMFRAPTRSFVASSVGGMSGMGMFHDEDPLDAGPSIDEALERLGRRIGGTATDALKQYRNLLNDVLDARGVAPLVDWDRDAAGLAAGLVHGQSREAGVALGRVAALPAVAELAASLGKSAMTVAVALVAKAASGSRTADRIARTVLAGADDAKLKAALRAVGL